MITLNHFKDLKYYKTFYVVVSNLGYKLNNLKMLTALTFKWLKMSPNVIKYP